MTGHLPVAQPAEHRTFNPGVTRSNRVGETPVVYYLRAAGTLPA